MPMSLLHNKRLGKGAYGIVWKAVDRKTNDTIALKKIFDAFRNATDAQRTFREIMFLQEFGRHPNIIKLFNIIRADNDKDIYLAFEYMEADLHNVIKKMTILKDIHKQYIMCQLFRAVKFLHSGNVLHRDLKPSNVLLDADCRVKLADFGLARSFSQMDDYLDGTNMPELTEYVATRWYRSPEILLAAKRYTKGKALFPGSSTINQIERIMNSISRPSKHDIESIGSMYAASVLDKMPQRPKRPLEAVLAQSFSEAIDLVNRRVAWGQAGMSQFFYFGLLLFAPHKRLNVEQCLTHPYVAQFHNALEEPALDYEVKLPLPDHIQLSVHEYREKLKSLQDDGAKAGGGGGIQNTKHRNDFGSTTSVERKEGLVGRKFGLINGAIGSLLSRSTSESKALHHPLQNGGGHLMKSQPHHLPSSQSFPVKVVEPKKQQQQAPIAQSEPSDTDLDESAAMSLSATSAVETTGTSMGSVGTRTPIRPSSTEGDILHSEKRSSVRMFGQKQKQPINSDAATAANDTIRDRAQSFGSTTKKQMPCGHPKGSTLRENDGKLHADEKQRPNLRSTDRLRFFSALRPTKHSRKNPHFPHIPSGYEPG
uniref:Mitogen-activated protein kinase n=1 Tax=Globodera pallida TaxID=36090 RepID=A0A183CAA8_GLOPA